MNKYNLLVFYNYVYFLRKIRSLIFFRLLNRNNFTINSTYLHGLIANFRSAKSRENFVNFVYKKSVELIAAEMTKQE